MGKTSKLFALWCPLLESRGISLEKFSYRSIPLHHTKQGCFGRLAVRATCCTRNFFKKPCAIGGMDIFTCFGPVLYEGSMEEVCLENANLLSEISISGRLVTRRGKFSPIAHNPGHLLCAFWTAGFTPRPPDIGSARCNGLFQVSNRTIGCILDRSARLYGLWWLYGARSYGKV
jgi:hypothetical protein